jgi:uncharacterized protein YndB with AHSA1/START domain
MTQLSFTVTDTIQATPSEVFDALTKEIQLREWSGDGIVEPKQNGKFEMFDGWVHGHVLEFDPPRRLSYTWKPDDWSEEWEPSVVLYKFVEMPEGTRVTIEHSKLPTPEEASSHRQGWFDHVLNPLKEYLEK